MNMHFREENEVIQFLCGQIEQNGDPTLSGLEEEIVVVTQDGKPLPHKEFQRFLGGLIRSLPEGEILSGRSVNGEELPVLRGIFKDGWIQPETNTTLVEYAHKPTADSWACYRQSKNFSKILAETAERHGLYVIGAGVVPTISWEDFICCDAVIPNADYVYSWTHMTQGTRPEYCRTVFGTASTHHNMGFNDPERMARYMSTVLRLQPTMIAMTSNAPIWNNERAGNGKGPVLSHRSVAQIEYGLLFGACGVDYLYPDFLLAPDIDFTTVVRGYLAMPLDRTIVNGQKVHCGPFTMAQYMREGLADDEGVVRYPDEAAITMMFREPIVDVRPAMTGSAPRVEARAHDCVSQPVAVALDAFYRGILAKLDETYELVSGMEACEVRAQRLRVCFKGLAAPLAHADPSIKTQQKLALQALALAEEGLKTRGCGEEQLLSPLWVVATSGNNPAQRLLKVWQPKDKQKILSRLSYGKSRFADETAFQWPKDVPSNGSKPRGVSCAPSF